MKLSIITPYYNALMYIRELAKILNPQLTYDVQWIIIDDGCNENDLDSLGTLNTIVIHLPKNSGCAGVPRNYGLDMVQGEYITFIDADDFVADNFIETILNKIESSDFDYCLMSWKNVTNNYTIDITNGRPEWNCSVWGIVYKKDLIGDARFNNSRIAEDFTFNQQVLKGKEEKITDIMYYYRPNKNGIMNNYRMGEK